MTINSFVALDARYGCGNPGNCCVIGDLATLRTHIIGHWLAFEAQRLQSPGEDVRFTFYLSISTGAP